MSRLEEVDVIYSKVKETFKTATTRSDKDMLYFQKLIVLFFYATAKYIEYCPAKASRMCTEMFNCVQETLSKKCIPKLFPNGFGNASSKRGIYVETAKKELMVSVTHQRGKYPQIHGIKLQVFVPRSHNYNQLATQLSLQF